MATLALIRHGETVGQSSIRLYGATNVALAPEGEQQITATARGLGEGRFDAVFASPLERARRSAEVALQVCAHPPIAIELVEGFREIDFGRWEGWTWAEVDERDPEGLARWRADGPRFVFPGGEAKAGFQSRVQSAIGPSIEARLASGAERILVVAHKGVIKAIASALLEQPMAALDGLHLPLGVVRWMHGRSGAWSLDPVSGDLPPAPSPS